MLDINIRFLEQQNALGRTFWLSHNPYDAAVRTGGFLDELNWLEKSYKYVEDSGYWRVVPK